MKKLLVFLVTLVFTTSILFGVIASGASISTNAKLNTNKPITISGVITKVNPGMPFKEEIPALETANSTYILTGNIKNIEKYIGYNAVMIGNSQKGPQGILFFNVKDFKILKKNDIISTPIPSFTSKPSSIPLPSPSAAPTTVTITEKDNGGYVYVKKDDIVKLVLESNQTTGYSWQFDQKPDENILLLTNQEYVLNQDDINIAGAGGSQVWTFKSVEAGTTVMYLSYSRPWESVPPAKNFKVKVIVDPLPTPSEYPPSPTPSATSKTHTVISNKAIYVSDPAAGSGMDAVGNATISWTDGTQNAFFKAKANVPMLNIYANYEFELAEATACDSSSITGYFNVKLDGKLLAERIHGRVYLLDGSVGSYYKFYSDGEIWHVSGYITERIDF